MTKKNVLNRKVTQIALAVAAALCVEVAWAIPGNTQLPSGFENVIGGVKNPIIDGNKMTITQDVQTAVNKWGNFSVGADAIVNFEGPKQFNSINFVNSGAVSEIYGQINANNNGNIFIANPAGVQIGVSAQINVGSLYVTNKDISQLKFSKNQTTQDVIDAIGVQAAGAAELMSMGTIIASEQKVTFDGDRVVIDTDRLYADTENKLETSPKSNHLIVQTTDKDNVVLGYSAYDEEQSTYANTKEKQFSVVVNGSTEATTNGYMWVGDLFQLQNISTNVGGWYALRNSIDADFTSDASYGNGDGKGFTPIQNFSGRFDGLGNNIFSLTIKRDDVDNVALFGSVNDGSYIRNVNIISGSVTGNKNVGSVIGSAGSIIVENIINTANVTGVDNVGGIVGSVNDKKSSSDQAVMSGLINVGTVTGTSSIGGIAGSAEFTVIEGETYNLGAVRGQSDEIGGIVGSAVNIEIGNADDEFQIYNQANVEGGYNVGGIIGSLTSTNDGVSSVVNVANHGAITALGYTGDQYKYHTAESQLDPTIMDGFESGVAMVEVQVANIGGIVGKASNEGNQKESLVLSNILNDGNILTSESQAVNDTYYTAGNVGGIVGSAENIAISDATNRENTIAGAHNIGGIAGFLKNSSIKNGTNDGGDITGTGARRYGENGAVAQERVRPDGHGQSHETFIIGNIGGIAGYMVDTELTSGSTIGSFIENSTNRGTVHSRLVPVGTPIQDVLESMKAANVGGVVGKLDAAASQTLSDIGLDNDYQNASVRHSYNTGSVQGYTGVGGVVGMMYNGSVAKSFNTGTIQSSRQATVGTVDPLNMGGIVGDATEGTKASAVLYDVYNAGQIGDSSYTFYGRHVGGIAGRLSGDIYHSYNTGDIYNGYSVVGGIVGYWVGGTIENVFNTGNITVVNKDDNNAKGSQVGGLIGAFYLWDGDNSLQRESSSLTLAYNLGSIRSFTPVENQYGNTVSGIVGTVDIANKLSVQQVYTLGNLYAAKQWNANQDYESTGSTEVYKISSGQSLLESNNVYYISPENTSIFSDLSNQLGYGSVVAWKDRSSAEAYEGLEDQIHNSPETGIDKPDDGKNWRLYAGGLLILNDFLSGAENYFSNQSNLEDIKSIQYGTAYNPLLTIVTAKDNVSSLTFDWRDLNVASAEDFVVHNAGLTLNNFDNNQGHYYAGTVFADGALNINASQDASTLVIMDGAEFYGSSVLINTNGRDALISGLIQATGSIPGSGSVSVISNGGSDFEILGQLNSAQAGAITTISGISATAPNSFVVDSSVVKDPMKSLTTISDIYAINVNASGVVVGDVTVETEGAVSILYGNMQNGAVSSAGDFTVVADGGIYLDSKLSIGGDLNLTSDEEILLDITADDDVDRIHHFLDHFKNVGTINLSGSGDFQIAVDLWNDATGSYNLSKYDKDHTFTSDLDMLRVKRKDENGQDVVDYQFDASKSVYLWVEDAQQLAGIQQFVNANPDSAENFLGFNIALKDNVDASSLTGFESIGTGVKDGFRGNFDGRGYRILGLNVTGEDAGLFAKIGQEGTVHDLRVYASDFVGVRSAGTIAAENNGLIYDVVTLGNHITAEGNASEVITGTLINGAAGGLAGINNGVVYGSTASDMVVAAGEAVTAGGLVGVNGVDGLIGKELNENGTLDIENAATYLITADSAVSASNNLAAGIGGAVGVNIGTVTLTNSTGVTNGRRGTDESLALDRVGGIAGENAGTMVSLYNESIVMGHSIVGGIVGENTSDSKINNAVNTSSVDGLGSHVGGVAGINMGSVTSGRNTGTVTGKEYVGGMVGQNGREATLNSLSNALAAEIIGQDYVGGIAGENSGEITGDMALINEGAITGHSFVGGVAGKNSKTGKISATNTAVTIHAAEGKSDSDKPMYFGGVVGYNDGAITDVTNRSNVDLSVEGGSFVGGIVGYNSEIGKFVGELINVGNIAGLSGVGGIAGSNENGAVLQGSEKERLTVVNRGNVTAANGGAGGIFYKNTGEIKFADLINEGTVTGNFTSASGTVGGTGGLFGINYGDIQYSTLTNSGDIDGGQNTGGLIGYNTGNVINSSLVNAMNATVIGGDVTGGLIGFNTAAIKGGQASGVDGLSYYAYQIYNNGVVEGQSYVGGLIGRNEGDLVAAYNTGAIIGSGESVGGVVGINATNSSIDQVFNTVLTNGNQPEIVQGASIVGGVVGINEGTLSNAYNTTGVIGTGQNGVVGNLVGQNNGTVSLAFATNDQGCLIGSSAAGAVVQNAYTFVESDSSGIFVQDAERTTEKGYDLFDFGKHWKVYEGQSLPMLKVFLTQTKVSSLPNVIVYNGKDKSFVDYVTAADELAAYNNAEGLLNGITNKDAGDYVVWSQQISIGEDGTHNNLGYDIDLSYTIDKAKLNVTLDEIERTYGSLAFETAKAEAGANGIRVETDQEGYGLAVAVDSGLTDEMRAELESGLNADFVNDGSLTGESSGRVTQNVGTYEWTANVDLGDLAKNYEFDSGVSKITTSGHSIIKQASLRIDINNVTMTYGQNQNEVKGQYQHGASGLVNGDVLTDVLKDVTYENSAYINDTTTRDVGGDYHVTIQSAEAGKSYGNYDISYVQGDVTMNKADLRIDINDVTMTYGQNQNEVKGQYQHGASGLVNGDVLTDVLKDVTYENSAYINDTTTRDVGGDYHVTIQSAEAGKSYGNYNISYVEGDVTMNKATLALMADNQTTILGQITEFTGTNLSELQNQLVNGDQLVNIDIGYGLKDASILNALGHYDGVIGLILNGKYYGGGTYNDWSRLFSNYNVTVKAGSLDVVAPHIPDEEPTHYGYIYQDGWDKSRVFRERKALIEFVEGGVNVSGI